MLLDAPRSNTAGARCGFAWSSAEDILALGVGGLWLVRPGDTPRQVARGCPSRLTWPPDGRRIAYIDQQDLEVIDVEEATVRHVTADLQTFRPGPLVLRGWWPDGRRLLFSIDPQGSGSILADGLNLPAVSPAYDR